MCPCTWGCVIQLVYHPRPFPSNIDPLLLYLLCSYINKLLVKKIRGIEGTKGRIWPKFSPYFEKPMTLDNSADP